MDSLLKSISTRRNLKLNKFTFGTPWRPDLLISKHWFVSSVRNFCCWIVDVPPRETSPAAKSEEKRMFSQTNNCTFDFGPSKLAARLIDKGSQCLVNMPIYVWLHHLQHMVKRTCWSDYVSRIDLLLSFLLSRKKKRKHCQCVEQ